MVAQIMNEKCVEKEEVPGFHFPKNDVIHNEKEKDKRLKSLIRATQAGNLDKVKFKILFEDDEGLKVVHTTIWATTEENIILKHDSKIPIRRIHKVAIA